MQPTIDTRVLGYAMANALSNAGVESDCENDDVGGYIASLVEDATKTESEDLNPGLAWYRPILAVIDPIVKLTAIVVNSPLTDNSTAAVEAVAKIRAGIATHLAAHLEDVERSC